MSLHVTDLLKRGPQLQKQMLPEIETCYSYKHETAYAQVSFPESFLHPVQRQVAHLSTSSNLRAIERCFVTEVHGQEQRYYFPLLRVLDLRNFINSVILFSCNPLHFTTSARYQTNNNSQLLKTGTFLKHSRMLIYGLFYSLKKKCYTIHVLWKYYQITSPYRKEHMPQQTNPRPTRLLYDHSGDLDFLLSTLDTENFVCFSVRKEPPFIHTSFDCLMAINNNISSLISPQDQTSLSGDVFHFKWKS